MAATIGDIYAVSVIFSQPGGTAQCNFGFECVTNVAGDAQANLGAAFQTAMIKNTSGGLLNEVYSTTTTSRLEVEDVKPGTLATYVRTYSPVAGSAVSGESAPPQCAVVLSMRTALKGRSYRGRVYIPGLAETSQNAGQIASAGIAAYAAMATQLLAVFGPAGSNGDWRLAVISRYANKLKRLQPVATQVTSITADQTIRTQRRRVLGVGS
jgi:hypothetical protein